MLKRRRQRRRALTVFVEVLQEPLVDRVEVDDEEVAHQSIKAQHDGQDVVRAPRLLALRQRRD